MKNIRMPTSTGSATRIMPDSPALGAQRVHLSPQKAAFSHGAGDGRQNLPQVAADTPLDADGHDCPAQIGGIHPPDNGLQAALKFAPELGLRQRARELPGRWLSVFTYHRIQGLQQGEARLQSAGDELQQVRQLLAERGAPLPDLEAEPQPRAEPADQRTAQDPDQNVAGHKGQYRYDHKAQPDAEHDPFGGLARDRSEVQPLGQAPLRLRTHQPVRDVKRTAVQVSLICRLVTDCRYLALGAIALNAPGELPLPAGTGEGTECAQHANEHRGEDGPQRHGQRPQPAMQHHAPYPLPLKISRGTWIPRSASLFTNIGRSPVARSVPR